jgi:hypothetical protein
VSLSFAMSVDVADAGAAPVVDGAGTDADGLGGSDDDEVGVVHASDSTHHNTNTNAAMAITLIKSRSMVASMLSTQSGRGEAPLLRSARPSVGRASA